MTVSCSGTDARVITRIPRDPRRKRDTLYWGFPQGPRSLARQGTTMADLRTKNLIARGGDLQRLRRTSPLKIRKTSAMSSAATNEENMLRAGS
jgi:hypothetical protein